MNNLPVRFKEINSVRSARSFFRHLYEKEKVLFHPEDSFSEMVDRDGKPTYTKAQATERDRAMAQCRRVCGSEIYDVANSVRPT